MRAQDPAQREEWIAEMQARTEQAHTTLVEAVTGLTRRDGWRAWLDFAARLPSYSVSNQLLLAAQAPDATLVMSAKAWREVGRYPAKGSKALRIWAPRRAPRTSEPDARETEPDEQRPADEQQANAPAGPEQRSRQREQPRFLLVPVFDQAQTAGEPIPQQPAPVPPPPGQAPHGMWPALVDYAQKAGFRVEFGDCGRADGTTDYRTGTITIAEKGSQLSRALTLAHEIGHATLHADAAARQPDLTHRGRAEVEAESIAYLVAADYGLATAADWHFDYLAHWSSRLTGPNAEADTVRGAVRETAGRVLAAARPLLTHLRDASVGHPDAWTTTAVPEPAPVVVAVVTP